MGLWLFLISAVRAVIELSMWCLLGQWVLYLIAGHVRQRNAVYCLLRLMTGPWRCLLGIDEGQGVTRWRSELLLLIFLVVMWLIMSVIKNRLTS